MADFTIELDLARDLPKVRRAYGRLVKRIGQCSYMAPCAIGTMMTPAQRGKLMNAFCDGTPIDDLIHRGVVKVPPRQTTDFLLLQEAFDKGDREGFAFEPASRLDHRRHRYRGVCAALLRRRIAAGGAVVSGAGDDWAIRLEWRHGSEPMLSLTGRAETRQGLEAFIRDLELARGFLASAIEAAAAGETTKIGSTEGESATRQGDAQ